MDLEYSMDEHSTRKTCKKCNVEKPLFQFHKQVKGYLGRRPQCVECRGCPRKLTKDERKLHKANYWKAWRIDNIEHAKAYSREYQRRRRKLLKQRLIYNIRQRVTKALKQNRKPCSCVKSLGCSVGELKLYLESKFLPGMTWKNYGRTGWHIDHIKPLCKFDLSDANQFIEACHYTNLQPLWAVDNWRKGSS